MGRKICLKQRICFIPVLALLNIFAHAQQYDSIFTFNTVETLFPVLNEKIQVVHIPAPEFVKGVKQPVFSLNGNWQFTA